jgi:hypothetical protein
LVRRRQVEHVPAPVCVVFALGDLIWRDIFWQFVLVSARN